MSTTTTTTPSVSVQVPPEVHHTASQTHIRSLLRTTKLRISLSTKLLAALRFEETLLLACLPALRDQSLADIARLNQLGGKIVKLEEQVDEDEGKKLWLEGTYAATVEHEKRKERGEPVESEPEKRPVFDWENLEVSWE